MKINKIIGLVVTATALAFSYTGSALAHVTVKPSDARTGAYETFAVSVPSEKDSPTVSIRLIIPESLTDVTPTVKSSWTIQAEKRGKGDDAMIAAITWSGGMIEAGYRDDFTFRAKTPDRPTDLEWKAYQTYQDGTVVSWDQQAATSESEDAEGATAGSFSVTKVASDSDQDKALKSVGSKAGNAQSAADRATLMSMAAIVLALVALAVAAIRGSAKKNVS